MEVNGQNLLESNGSDEDIRKSRSISIRRIVVEGYDTWLSEYEVDAALRKHFASCGDVVDVYFPITACIRSPLNRFAFMYLRGEDAEEKALKLSGTDVGGWNVVAEAYPFHENRLEPELAPTRVHAQSRFPRMGVSVYGNSRVVDNVETIVEEVGSLLKNEFSAVSCSKCQVFIHPNRESGGILIKTMLSVKGEDAVEKALKLSGGDVGGWNFSVAIVFGPPKVMGTCYMIPGRRSASALSLPRGKKSKTCGYKAFS